MLKKSNLQRIFIGLIIVGSVSLTAFAQTTVFTYQGKLTDNGTPQAVYQMEFRLFGSPGGNDQIGSTITNNNVAVNGGVFTVNLNFDLPPRSPGESFPGADRFLEISVRRSPNESFVTLNPRQQITSSPYSIRTLSAAQADVALDSQKLGGIDASEYVTTSTAGNSFIRNSTTQQTADFNVSGNGTLGGTLRANQFVAQTGAGSYGLTHTDGARILSSYTSASGGWFGTRSNHPLNFFTNDSAAQMTVNTAGNIGIGTIVPATRLALNGGPTWTSNGWTGSLSMGNGSALGWEANASGQRFGIGQSTGGLYFFRTFSAFGSTINQANYDMGITDNGNITQPRDKGGFAKALVYLNPNGTIGRCYNAVSGSSSGGCGFSIIPDFDAGVYIINFGFQVDDRYVSVSALDSRPSGGCRGPSASVLNLSGSTVTVSSGCGNGITYDGPVMVMIY